MDCERKELHEKRGVCRYAITDLRDQFSQAQAATPNQTYSTQNWTKSLDSEQQMTASLCLQGHTSMVNRAVVLGCSLSCSDDKLVESWRIEVGGVPALECIHTMQGHTHWVNDVGAVSDEMIATASSD